MGWDPKWHGQSHTHCGPGLTWCHQTTPIRKGKFWGLLTKKKKTGKKRKWFWITHGWTIDAHRNVLRTAVWRWCLLCTCWRLRRCGMLFLSSSLYVLVVVVFRCVFVNKWINCWQKIVSPLQVMAVVVLLWTKFTVHYLGVLWNH